jgi:ATP-binding cassette subfamily B (MDR/TAP) protein 1
VAENIVVMSYGPVVEQGTHKELIKKRPVDYELVEKQRMSTEGDIGPSEESPRSTQIWNSYMKHKGNKSNIQAYQIKEANSDRKAYDHRHSLWELTKFVANFNKQETFTVLWGLFFSVITGAGNPT